MLVVGKLNIRKGNGFFKRHDLRRMLCCYWYQNLTLSMVCGIREPCRVRRTHCNNIKEPCRPYRQESMVDIAFCIGE